MNHTKTLTYKRSMELAKLSAQTTAQLPHGYGFLADQLRRASSSIVLNFAEGNAKASTRERRRFFRIAKGSVLETAAVFDVAVEFGVVESSRNKHAQDLCDHVAALLHLYK